MLSPRAPLEDLASATRQGTTVEGEPLLPLARRQDVVIWPHEIASGATG